MTNDSSAEQPRRNLGFEVSSSPTKRSRTLTLTQSPISTSKGKEKIEEIKDENEDEDVGSESKTCGICFCEDRNAIRGCIDSCNHFFCFICIMEWSKVESRCPMCKQRFCTILRPPKDGIFLNERIVSVPVRDQVWHPFGNATTGPPDLYAQVNCTVCHSSLDENLLLLCDLCDSANHTYCVGLGCTVPEGDWYCHDCTISRNDHTNSQNDADSSQCSRKFNTTQVAGASVSISEIVQESYFVEFDRPPRNSSQSEQLLSSSVPDRDIGSRTKTMDPSVRTLQNCQNVQSRIQSLRENWNALQGGSLSFSSSLPCSDKKNYKDENRPLIHKLSQPQSSSNTGCPPKINNEMVSSGILNSKSSHDIEKAWKMMNMARSMKQACEGTIIGCREGKRNVPKVSNSSTSCSISKGKLFKGKELGDVESENYRCHDLERAQNMHRSKKSEKQKPNEGPVSDISKLCKWFPSTDPLQSYERPSPEQAHTFAPDNLCSKRRGNLTVKVMNRGTSSSNGCSESICFGSLSESTPGGSDMSCRISECGTSSGCTVELPKEKHGVQKIPFEGGVGKDDGVKSEVQSLVKLNLKLLSRNKKLGVNEFKEVARLATHTILAACGLEHRKSSACTIPKLICKHSDQNQLLHMLNLMPSSCRECFYVFVKDVVCSIMIDKGAYVQSNCPI